MHEGFEKDSANYQEIIRKEVLLSGSKSDKIGEIQIINDLGIGNDCVSCRTSTTNLIDFGEDDLEKYGQDEVEIQTIKDDTNNAQFRETNKELKNGNNMWVETFRNIGKTIKNLFKSKKLKALLGAGIVAGGIAHTTSFSANAEEKSTNTQESIFLRKTDNLDRLDSVTRFRAGENLRNYIHNPEIAHDPTEEVIASFESWKEEVFSPYRIELTQLGCKNEDRINYCAKMLYAWDCGDDPMVANIRSDYKKYISREEIVQFCIDGKNPNVIVDGSNMIWIVSAEKEVEKRLIKGFNDAVDWYKNNKAPDFLESICNNGVCFIYSPSGENTESVGTAYLSRLGYITVFLSEKNLKTIKTGNPRNVFIQQTMVESYGIVYRQMLVALGVRDTLFYGTPNDDCDLVKSSIAGYMADSLSGVDKDGKYEILAKSHFKKAEKAAKNLHLSIEDEKFVKLLRLMPYIIDPIGYDSLFEIDKFNKLISVDK